jgi:HD-like signal output (HDOD) protein
MKTPRIISQAEVIEKSQQLPGFPTIINDILATLDDPDGNLNVLSHCIEHDPLISARVLSSANTAAQCTRRLSEVNDIYTATSLIGTQRVRDIALTSSVGRFMGTLQPGGPPVVFWKHSVSIGVCGQELARYVDVPVCANAALMAGLLHDIGQLWLYCFEPQAEQQCWQQSRQLSRNICELEQDTFGVDHAELGGWLAEHWLLPPAIVGAIRGHHRPDDDLDQPLVPLVHIAEVLGNALALSGGDENRVTYVSAAACERLGVVWDDRMVALFGQMEARSRYANTLFTLSAPA